MPAYNAAQTLERTYADIPHELVHRIILVDDVSRDETVDIARQLGLDVIIHAQNRGYGGNQKTCYDAALEAGADIVVMLHPDYQYDATRIPDLIAPIAAGERDLMLGSRFLGDPLAGGMPQWKYVSNRFLTTVENIAFELHLSEYHTGLRAYSRRLLETIPYQANSDDFVFDQELIAQVVAAGMRRRIGEIAVPTRYFEEASLGRLPAERRLRPVDPPRGRPLPAPPAAHPAFTQADRPRTMTLGRSTLLRASLGIAISVIAIWVLLRSVDIGAAIEVLSTANPACIGLMIVTMLVDVGARAARWRWLLRPDQARALPADARLHVPRLPRQQRPAGPARRALPEPRRGRGGGHQPDDRPGHGRRRAGRRHGHRRRPGARWRWSC